VSPRPRGAPRRRRERAELLLDRLAAQHPDAAIALEGSNPLELLVATILSAQCTDARVNVVTRDLFRRFRTPRDYLAVPADELEDAIRPTGFFRSKTAAIRAAMATILERHGGEVPATMEELVGLRGVGRKTAAVVASNAYGAREGIAVDTHVRRVSRRLGLTRQPDPDRIEQDLMRLYEPVRWLQVSDVLIFHGRRICKARTPLCERCAVCDLCPSSQVPRGLRPPGGCAGRLDTPAATTA
jgi:endonuclease III